MTRLPLRPCRRYSSAMALYIIILQNATTTAAAAFLLKTITATTIGCDARHIILAAAASHDVDDGNHNSHYQNKKNHHQTTTSSSSSFQSLEELDQARRKFESLLIQSTLAPSASSSSSSHHRPLSTSSRRRRQLEIDLLQSLEDSDDAVDELVMLWTTERGPHLAHILQDMEEHCSTGLVQEEAMLRQMKRDHEDWLEVRFRLAMLLYYKGQTAESKTLCWHVLFYKPWHLEAIHLAMLLAFREGRTTQVWKWARERLPPLHPSKGNSKRKKWVQTAVARAQESLERAELELLQSQQQQSLSMSFFSSSSSPTSSPTQQQQTTTAEDNTFW